MPFALRLVLCLGLGAIFIWLSFLNWRVFYLRITKRESPSWIPLMGGVSGSLALILFPGNALVSYWWRPLLLDYGCLPGLTHLAYWWVARSQPEK